MFALQTNARRSAVAGRAQARARARVGSDFETVTSYLSSSAPALIGAGLGYLVAGKIGAGVGFLLGAVGYFLFTMPEGESAGSSVKEALAAA